MEKTTQFEQHQENGQEIQKERIEGIIETLEVAQISEEVIFLENALSSEPEGSISLYDKLSEHSKSLFAAVVFALASQAGFAQSGAPSKLDQDASYAAFLKVKEEAKKIAGFDVVGEAMKVKRIATYMTPDLENKKPAKFTILHIGQTHNLSDDPHTTALIANKIATSQYEIARFLSSTTTPETKVFIEGVTSGQEDLFSNTRIARKMIYEAATLEDLERIHNQVNDYHGLLNKPSINRAIAEKLTSFGFKEKDLITYSNGTIEYKLAPTGLFPEHEKQITTTEGEELIAGAAELLDARELIKAQPSEKMKHYQKIGELTKVLQNKTQKLSKIYTSLFGVGSALRYKKDSITQSSVSVSFFNSQIILDMANSEECKKNIECQNLAKDVISRDLPEIRKVIFDDREDEAVESIAQAVKSGETQKVFPLVYGSAHDFTRAVVKWNTQHPEMQFNLVTVK